MAAPAHIARENGKLGGRPKGSKGWKRIAVEKFREEYIKKMQNDFDEITNIHLEQAKVPENFAERQYAINQTIGKPVEKMEVEQTTTLKVDV